MAAKILLQGSVVRATYGILALLFPKLLMAGMRNAELDENARYFNRLFGGRDLLVAGATYGAVKAGALSPAVKANIVCEVTDTVSLLEELRARGRMDRFLAIGLGFNIGGYATWFRASRALRVNGR